MAGEADSRDLWGKALEQLSEDDRRVVGESQLSGSRLETLDYIRQAAEQEKQRCIEKGWSVHTTTSGKKVKLRHVLEKISAWISELINVVNVAVAFDASGHAAAPWGVVKFLVGAATSNIAVFTDLGEGIELTTRLITRYAVIERLYLRDDFEATPQLTKHITEIYVSILSYLSAAKRYFQAGTIKKVGHGIRDFLTKQYKSMLESISEVEVEKWLRTADRLLQQKADEDAAERHRVLKETLERLDQPIMKMAVQLSAIQDQLNYKKRTDVFQWMSKVPYGSHFEQNSKRLLEDSGQWLLKSREFFDWSSSNESCVLWLSGPWGSGKTSLVSLVLKRLLRHSLHAGNACPIAFFYCSRDTAEPDRADPDRILGALVKQLSGTQPTEPIREPVAIEYSKRKAVADVDGQDPKPLDVEDCTKLITQLCNVNPASIFVDALDECDESRLYELLESLDQIVSQSGETVKVFLSSRENIDITQHIQTSKVIRSRIVPEKNCQDINTFIETEVQRLHSKKLLLRGQISPKLQRKTVKKLQNGASGMFRWVTLSLETLSSIKHPKDYEKALGSLPPELFKLYDIIYNEMMESGKHASRLVIMSLTLVLSARRQLSVREFLAAVSEHVNADDESDASSLSANSDTDSTDSEHSLALKKVVFTSLQIVDICRSFVTLDSEENVIRFAHPSVREFLVEKPQYYPANANSLLLQRCLDELKSPSTAAEPNQPLSIAHVTSATVFYRYAAPWWMYHYGEASQGALSPPVQRKLDEFLFGSTGNGPSESYKQWLQISHPNSRLSETNPGVRVNVESASNALMLASSLGWNTMADDMIKRHGFNPNDLADEGLGPLHAASRSGYLSTVQLLLRHGALPDLEDKVGRTPLCHAAWKGHKNVVQLLLDTGEVDPDSKDQLGYTPLMYSSGLGVATLLLRTPGVNPAHVAFDGETALSQAWSPSVIEELLKFDGVDINSRDRFGRTPLCRAARSGDLELVRFLLGKAETDRNAADIDGRTPIHWASILRRHGAINLLMNDSAVDLHAPDTGQVRSTPMSWLKHHFATKDRLLDWILRCGPVDPNIRTRSGFTLLMEAINCSNWVAAWLFLEDARVNPDLQNSAGKTAVHLAAQSCSPDFLQALLEHSGSDIQDNSGRTPLSYAAEEVNDVIIKILLASDKVDPNTRDYLGRSPLSWSVKNWRPSIDNQVKASIKAFLADGRVDVDSCDNAGRTPVSIAAGNGYVEIVKVLIKMGKADTGRPDNNGWTPLRWAQKNRYKKVAAMLRPATECEGFEDLSATWMNQL